MALTSRTCLRVHLNDLAAIDTGHPQCPCTVYTQTIGHGPTPRQLVHESAVLCETGTRKAAQGKRGLSTGLPGAMGTRTQGHLSVLR